MKTRAPNFNYANYQFSFCTPSSHNNNICIDCFTFHTNVKQQEKKLYSLAPMPLIPTIGPDDTNGCDETRSPPAAASLTRAWHTRSTSIWGRGVNTPPPLRSIVCLAAWAPPPGWRFDRRSDRPWGGSDQRRATRLVAISRRDGRILCICNCWSEKNIVIFLRLPCVKMSKVGGGCHAIIPVNVQLRYDGVLFE